MVREGDAGRALVARIRERPRSHGAHAHRLAHGDAGRLGGGEPHGGRRSGGPLCALAGPARPALAALGGTRRPRVALASAASGAASSSEGLRAPGPSEGARTTPNTKPSRGATPSGALDAEPDKS